MAITRLGTVGGFSSTPGVMTASAASITVPAGGIPTGVTLIMFGFFNGSYIHATAPFSDSKGNTWITRLNPAVNNQIFLADCQVTTALAAGDTLTFRVAGAGSYYAFVAFWYNRIHFDRAATVDTWTGTTAKGGTITTPRAGELVLGGFGTYTSENLIPVITVPSGAYLNEPGAHINANAEGIGFDWESKVAAAAGAETAQATVNYTNSYFKSGATVAYRESIAKASQPIAGALVNGGQAGTPKTVPFTAAAPAGARLLVFGAIAAEVFASTPAFASITDSKGNSYTIRRNGGVFFLADSLLTTALTTSDTLTLTYLKYAGSQQGIVVCAAAFTGLGEFDQLGNPRIGVPADPVVTAAPWGLVLGFFDGQPVTMGLDPAPGQHGVVSQIVTPGSGYTNELGGGIPANANEDGFSIDWEWKIAPAKSSVEFPSATMTSFSGPHTVYCIAAAYKEEPPPTYKLVSVA